MEQSKIIDTLETYQDSSPKLTPTVLTAEQGPHRVGMALKRSDSALDELLHHHRRSHAAVLQPP